MPEPERIDRRRAALIAYDVCRRALTPSDPARRAAMSPVLDVWVRIIATARLQDLCAEATARFQALHIVETGKAQSLFECRRDDCLFPKRIEHVPKRAFCVSPQIFIAN